MTALNGHSPIPLETARELLSLGIHSVPVRYHAKTVTRGGWIYERWEANDLDAKFGGLTNIGILLGAPSNQLVDCDLDTPEAVAAGAYFLPPTDMVWGRPGKPRSHHGYLLDILGPKNLGFKDPTMKKTDADAERRAMLCELRLKGQTIGPGSVHPNGETISWDGHAGHEPCPVAYEVLKVAIGRVAACALLARYWTEGIRHDAALPLAGLMCRGGLDENQAVHFMRVLCTVTGETPEDTQNRIGTVTDTYARADRGEHYTGAQTLEEYFDARIVARLRDWLGLTKLAYSGDLGPDGWPLSDIGNAERFRSRWQGQALCCQEEDTWYLWSGKRWERDRKHATYKAAMEVVAEFRTLAHNPATVSKGNTPPELWRRHADKFGQLKQIRAMLELAGSLMPVTPDEFDADPMLLNCHNGTLEFQTSEPYLREFRPDDLLTMMTAASYAAEATSPLFDEYRGLFLNDPAWHDFFQEFTGTLLTGMPKRHALQLIGPTNSGKSLTLALFGRVLGDYAGTLKYDSLMARTSKGDVPRSDLWNVRNKRLVTVAEIPPNTEYDVALFKTLLSGGDKQLVRTLYDRTGGQSIAFAFALMTSGNEAYGPPSGEEAAYERLHVLRFTNQVPIEQRNDTKQQATLDMERTGAALLAWMVDGYYRLQREHRGQLMPPEIVRRFTRELQDENDPYVQILEDHDFLEFTHDDEDGVIMREAWECARRFREDNDRRGMKKIGDEKASWHATMVRRGAKPLPRTSVRFDNRESWSGVRWSPRFAREHEDDITMPNWQAP